jgi:hypothetical protein
MILERPCLPRTGSSAENLLNSTQAGQLQSWVLTGVAGVKAGLVAGFLRAPPCR